MDKNWILELTRMIKKDTIETFEDVINEDLFLKNIKRMFIMKQMKTHKIKKINIE